MQVKKQQLKLDMDQWIGSRLGKECQGCILSPCSFNLYAEHISQAEWITNWDQDCQENISNLRYVDDTTLTVESKEEVKNLLMRVKEESERASLKLNI